MIASVSTWSAHQQLLSGKLSAEAFLRLIREEGAEGVEIVDFDFENPTAETYQNFYDQAEKQGVEVTCLSIEHSLCRMTEKRRLEDVEKVREWMRLAKSLGVRNVRIFTGWMENEAPYHTQLEWVYEGMRLLTDEAEKLDVDLVLIAAGFLGSQEYVTKAFGVNVDGRTNVATEPGKHATNVKNVFTAGDMHMGQSLVVRAIREGRDVAREVDESLMGYTNL